jgi:RsiW-degrading membrane proteinase PrsW (M82 family)
MTWRHYLQIKTRRPAFLWRMVIAILAVGVAGGLIAEHRFIGPQWVLPDAQANAEVDRLTNLAEAGAWGEVWWILPRVVYRRLTNPTPLLLASFAGLCWFVFCVQAAHTRSRRDPEVWLLPLAAALGGMSIWPTHFFGLWIEHRWNIHESAELVNGLRFYILGVGLPEELAKLLCFLPLVPVLLRIRSDLTALMAAASVGLGFAVVENIGYFQRSGGSDTVGRFLIANPLHMTLTGLAGLAAYRAARDFRGWGQYAVALIALMVFAHGLYDATIALPDLVDVNLFGTIIFAMVVYQFFRELRDLRPRRVETISLTANFLAGVSLVTAATFIYMSGLIGLQAAADAMAGNVIGLSLMAYLFLREMPDTMVTV